MKVKVPNEVLWQIAARGEDIDDWLENRIGYAGYKEWIGFTTLPYICFEIYDEALATLFVLRWL